MNHGDIYGNITSTAESVLLAAGEYESDTETILAGYAIYQKRYVVKRVVSRLILVAIAAVSAVMMLLTEEQSALPMLLLFASISLGWYFITEPLGNKKKLRESLRLLQGTKYKADIYSDKVIISLDEEPPEPIETNAEINEDNEEKNTNETDDLDEDDAPPATVIHLDFHVVDLIDRDVGDNDDKGMYIICVGKRHVFVIPKSAFTKEETKAVKEKLSVLMGIRYISKYK